jgi:type IX secretion system PorP/SprF family membrane protein
MIKYIFKLICVLVFVQNYAQNEFNVTQYMIHQPIINMASITTNDHINAAVLHRQQWVGFEGAPATSLFSANGPIGLTNLHLGGIASYDRIGANSITKLDLALAYRIKFNTHNFLGLALKGGVMNTVANYDDMLLQDQNDPEFSGGGMSAIQPDFGFSAYYFNRNFYGGFAIPSLFRNQNFHSETQLVVPEDFHYFTTLGYQFDLNESFDLGISTFIKGVLGAPLQFDLNAQLFYNEFIGFGVSYRSSNDLAAILSIKFLEKFTFSYSYDFGFSELARYHNNTHEFSLIFDAPKRNMIPIHSPRF